VGCSASEAASVVSGTDSGVVCYVCGQSFEWEKNPITEHDAGIFCI
jgi:transcription elongation factor Elf1